MRVLIACEFSGTFREAFAARGHDAWSVDLLPTEVPGQHHVGDALEFLHRNGPWDLLVAHPPCTYLCNSGVRWLYGGKGTRVDPERWAAMEAATDFFHAFQRAPVARIAIENPVMHRYARNRLGAASQVVQPWMFGHREMKATCWWLTGLPLLQPTDVVGPPPKDPQQRKAWAKVHRASPGENRWRERSRSYPGMAAAAADQWGSAP